MKKLFIILLFSTLTLQATQETAPVMQEVAPGVRINLNVINSADVDNQNKAQAANDSQPPTVHHVVTIKHEPEPWYKRVFFTGIVPLTLAALGGVFSKIPGSSTLTVPAGNSFGQILKHAKVDSLARYYKGQG